MILTILRACLLFVVMFGMYRFTPTSTPHFSDLETRYGWKQDESSNKPTKLDKLIAAYMKRDTLDPTSTINFLLEADKLTNPFDEAPMLPPPKPSDAAYSARPVQYHQSCCKCAMCVYETKQRYIENNPSLDFFPIGHPALSKPPEPF
jgi:hypothetical protein